MLFAIFAICTIGVLQFQLSERDKEIETLKSQAKIQIFNQKLDIRFLTNQVLVQAQKVDDQDKELKLLRDQINFLNTNLRESKQKELDTMKLRGEALLEMENSNEWSNENLNGRYIKLKADLIERRQKMAKMVKNINDGKNSNK